MLDEFGYPASGAFVGFDVKAMRTQKREVSMKHLAVSREVFLWLVEKVRSFDRNLQASLIERRDYEELNRYVLGHLIGAPYAKPKAISA